MIFHETKLQGAYVIDIERAEDERGFFARSFCQKEFRKFGLEDRMAQCNISFNTKQHTLRGLHYQLAPHAEAKLVRCTRGGIFDVIVDLRDGSPTCRQWYATELTGENRRMLYIPKGFAHGLLTLEDNTEVFYVMSDFYSPDHARGLRWDDPAIGIQWPVERPIVSERDKSFQLLSPMNA